MLQHLNKEFAAVFYHNAHKGEGKGFFAVFFIPPCFSLWFRERKMLGTKEFALYNVCRKSLKGTERGDAFLCVLYAFVVLKYESF